MRKKDFVIIAIFLLVAAILWIWTSKRPDGDIAAGEVVIYKDGQVFAAVPLTVERTVVVEDENGSRNVIRVEDGKAEMIEASCPDQICVHSRPVQKNGQSIICLPNRVSVEVRSTQENEIDGVSE